MYAFNAGLEMDMMSHAYDRHMKELVEEGKIMMAQVDESVRRVLRVKFRLGLFERPYTPVTSEKRTFFSVRKAWILPPSLRLNPWYY